MPKQNLIRKLPDGFEWKIEWAQDYPQDSSWMGDWSRNRGAGRFYVNAKTGELFGYPNHPLREGLPIYKGDRPDYHFWYPSDMRFSKDFQKEIAEWGMDEVLKWIIADYERHLAYVHNEWTFEYCLVSLIHEDFPKERICWDSLGGVESDRTKDYQIEVEENCMWSAFEQYDVDGFIKGHADDGTFGAEDYQAVIAEWREWEMAVKAQRQAAYEAQQAEQKEQKNNE